MDPEKKKRLLAKGWSVGDAKDIAGLTQHEQDEIDRKLALGRKVKALRIARGLTQQAAAELIGTSQSRFAEIERGKACTSFALLFRSLRALGAPWEDIGDTVGNSASA